MVVTKNNISRINEILKNKQSKKIGRFQVDIQTANAIIKVDKALKPTQRARFRRIVNSDIRRGSIIAQKLAFK